MRGQGSPTSAAAHVEICLSISQKNSLQVLSNIKRILAANQEMYLVPILRFLFNIAFQAEYRNDFELAQTTTLFNFFHPLQHMFFIMGTVRHVTLTATLSQ